MATDSEKPLNGRPEPFRRPVVWGRPPQTVFRAGPLPRGESLPPLPEPPRSRSAQPEPVGRSILGGSMIPRAPSRLAPTPPLSTATEPVVARASAAPANPVVQTDAPARATPDLTVRPLPLPEPLPVRESASLSLDAVPAFQPALRDEASSVSRTVPTRVRSKGPGRAVLYGGVAVAVVAVLAVVAWTVSRSPAEAPLAAAPPTPALATVPAAAPPSPAEIVAAPVVVPPAARPAPAVPAPAPIPVPRPTQARPAAGPAPSPLRASPPARAVQPAPVQPGPAVTAPPVVVIVPAPPPRGPAPTAAERPTDDPDAPITTRPQPIG